MKCVTQNCKRCGVMCHYYEPSPVREYCVTCEAMAQAVSSWSGLEQWLPVAAPPPHASPAPLSVADPAGWLKLSAVTNTACVPSLPQFTTVTIGGAPMRLVADPTLKPGEFRLEQPHPFVRGPSGPERLGPPDETCEVCQRDPRNSLHHSITCQRSLKGLACGCSFYLTPTPTDPLDVEHDGVTLRDLLHYDEVRRCERPSNYRPHTFTPAQRAAVSAHWSAELRKRVDAAKQKDRNQVTLESDE